MRQQINPYTSLQYETHKSLGKLFKGTILDLTMSVNNSSHILHT